MGYIIIIALAIFAIHWVSRNTFYWKTIVNQLWKKIYKDAYMMAILMKGDEISGSDTAKRWEKSIVIKGTLINAILDFVNYVDLEETKEDEDYQEETFGYGRFDLDFILSSAKRDPEIFKRVLKK